jgi:hypothetical protein
MKTIAKSASVSLAFNTNSFQASTLALNPGMPTAGTSISHEETIAKHSIRIAYAKNTAAQTCSKSQFGGCETVEPINPSRINDLFL